MLSYNPPNAKIYNPYPKWARFSPVLLAESYSLVSSNTITVKGPAGVRTANFNGANCFSIEVYKNGTLAGTASAGTPINVPVVNGDTLRVTVLTYQALSQYPASYQFASVLMTVTGTPYVYSYFIVTPEYESVEYLKTGGPSYNDPSYVIPPTADGDHTISYISGWNGGGSAPLSALNIQQPKYAAVEPVESHKVAFLSDYLRNRIQRVKLDKEMELLNTIDVTGPYDVSCTPYEDVSQTVYFAVTCPDSNSVRIYNATDCSLVTSVAVAGRPLHVAARKRLLSDTHDSAFWVSCYDSNKVASIIVTGNSAQVTYIDLTTGERPSKIVTNTANGAFVVHSTGIAVITTSNSVSYRDLGGEPSAICVTEVLTLVAIPSLSRITRLSSNTGYVSSNYTTTIPHITALAIEDIYNYSQAKDYIVPISICDARGNYYTVTFNIINSNSTLTTPGQVKAYDFGNVTGLARVNGVVFVASNYSAESKTRPPLSVPNAMESEVFAYKLSNTGSSTLKSEVKGPIEGVDNAGAIVVPQNATIVHIRGGNSPTATTAPVSFINGNYLYFQSTSTISNTNVYDEYHIPAVTRNFVWWLNIRPAI